MFASIRNSARNFIRDESGLTTVEYAVAGALIAAVVAGGFTTLGTTVNDVITGIAGMINLPTAPGA